jgi:phosphoribosylformylglycinamidine synthase II
VTGSVECRFSRRPGFSGDDGAVSIDEAKRPSVQVGDPYEEKRLIEACLALLDEHLVVGIQDLGGAGLVCATSETAARGGVGMDVDVNAVPLRELGMAPYEIMTSESQERMLAIITPENLAAVHALCDKWEVRAAVVGHVVEPTIGEDGVARALLRIRDGFEGEVLAEVPASALADDAPLYDRPRERPASLDAVIADDPTNDEPIGSPNEDLLDLLVDPSWVYRQYDSQLFLNTVVGPGRDAALLRLAGPGLPPSAKGIALSTDSNPRWCALDPRLGTAMTVAEGVANLACVGATAKAVVNCLNFGNPEHPSVMWQLSESIDGMAEGCHRLGLPVIGGNVSLYNESGGNDIDPTPVIGVLGVIDHLVAPPPGWNWREGDTHPLGRARATPRTTCPSRSAGRAGPRAEVAAVDASSGIEPETLVTTLSFVTREVASICAGKASDITAVHDVGGGGIAGGAGRDGRGDGPRRVGGRTRRPRRALREFPGRFLVATKDPADFHLRAAATGVPVACSGWSVATRLTIGTSHRRLGGRDRRSDGRAPSSRRSSRTSERPLARRESRRAPASLPNDRRRVTRLLCSGRDSPSRRWGSCPRRGSASPSTCGSLRSSRRSTPRRP